MWSSEYVTFNRDCSPQAEHGSASGIHDVGVIEVGDDWEKILSVMLKDAAEPVANEIGDSTGNSFVSATEDTPEPKALHTLALTNST